MTTKGNECNRKTLLKTRIIWQLNNRVGGEMKYGKEPINKQWR